MIDPMLLTGLKHPQFQFSLCDEFHVTSFHREIDLVIFYRKYHIRPKQSRVYTANTTKYRYHIISE